MSRLTFRDPVKHTAWQKQLRDSYADEGIPPIPHYRVKGARVRAVSRKIAEQIILKYEWLGTMATTGHHYGIFFGSYCAGVCCYAAGAATGGVNSHKEFGLRRTQLAILARGACVHWAPHGANSKLISWSCRLLKEDCPDLKLVVAYSDTDAGEIGTVYQAANWICIGKGASTQQYIAPSGRIYDQKLPYDLRRRNNFRRPRREYVNALLEAGWERQQSNPKWRYVYLLEEDERLRQLIEAKQVPYPKRVRSRRPGDAPDDQSGEGGSNPTRPLDSASSTMSV